MSQSYTHIGFLNDSNDEEEAEEEERQDVEEMITPDRLRALCGVENLKDAHLLEMIVDSKKTPLASLGYYVPNLCQLILSNSNIPTVRDLGTCLKQLQVLWLPRCHLTDLDGAGSFPLLSEIFAAYNHVSDLTPLSFLVNLKILDLEGNNLHDIIQVEFLTMCKKLKSLILEGNPICTVPGIGFQGDSYVYRQAILKMLPWLQFLDDQPVEMVTQTQQPETTLSTEKDVVQESIKELAIREIPRRPASAHGLSPAISKSDTELSRSTSSAVSAILARPQSALATCGFYNRHAYRVPADNDYSEFTKGGAVVSGSLVRTRNKCWQASFTPDTSAATSETETSQKFCHQFSFRGQFSDSNGQNGVKSLGKETASVLSASRDLSCLNSADTKNRQSTSSPSSASSTHSPSPPPTKHGSTTASRLKKLHKKRLTPVEQTLVTPINTVKPPKIRSAEKSTRVQNGSHQKDQQRISQREREVPKKQRHTNASLEHVVTLDMTDDSECACFRYGEICTIPSHRKLSPHELPKLKDAIEFR